jgi:hypothetical protein
MVVEMHTSTLALGATGRYFKLDGENGLAGPAGPPGPRRMNPRRRARPLAQQSGVG